MIPIVSEAPHGALGAGSTLVSSRAALVASVLILGDMLARSEAGAVLSSVDGTRDRFSPASENVKSTLRGGHKPTHCLCSDIKMMYCGPTNCSCLGQNIKPSEENLSQSCCFDCNGERLSCRNESCTCPEEPCKCPTSDAGGDCNDMGLRLQFMTAAQIALGAALLVAVTALAALAWKMCYRPGRRGLSRGIRRSGGLMCGLPSAARSSRSSADNASVNSIQNFVIQKMRDRPPKYEDAPPETPPCYEEAVGGVEARSPSDARCPPAVIYSATPFEGDSAPLCSASGGGPPADGHLGNWRPPGICPLGEEPESTGEDPSGSSDQPETRMSHSQDSSRTITVHSTVSNDDLTCGGVYNPNFTHELYEHYM